MDELLFQWMISYFLNRHLGHKGLKHIFTKELGSVGHHAETRPRLRHSGRLPQAAVPGKAPINTPPIIASPAPTVELVLTCNAGKTGIRL